MKKYFNWKLYQDNELIEEYKNKSIVNNKYLINDDLFLEKQNNTYLLYKKEKEYELVLDFAEKNGHYIYYEEDIKLTIELFNLKVIDKDNILTIIYSLDEDSLQFKIIIEKKA